MPHYHMQDYPVIEWILVVLVGTPIAGPDMNLYISLDQSSLGGNDSIPEISPLTIISPARVYYSYRFAAVSSQLCFIP